MKTIKTVRPLRGKRFRFALETTEQLRKHLGRKSLKCVEIQGSEKDRKDFCIIDTALLDQHARISKRRGFANGRTKRNGLILDPSGDNCYVGFIIIHSPGAMSVFKNNITNKLLISTFEKLKRTSIDHDFYLFWSSKVGLKNEQADGPLDLKKSYGEWFASTRDLQKKLDSFGIDDLCKDIGNNPDPTGKGLKRGGGGNYFCTGTWVSLKNVPETLQILAPLFDCLYENGETYILQRRNSSFGRHLKSYYLKLEKPVECGYLGCSEKSKLEAAHVIPVQDAGSDHGSNGIFLCKFHHNDPANPQHQEGKPLSWQKKKIKSIAKKGTVLS